MEIGRTLYLATRDEWRDWLKRNYSNEKEIWLIFYKKSANKISLSYAEAVEEALCFGWIDGISKKLDNIRYVQRMSPRRPDSSWSQSNIERVKKLIKNKRMTPAGLALFKA